MLATEKVVVRQAEASVDVVAILTSVGRSIGQCLVSTHTLVGIVVHGLHVTILEVIIVGIDVCLLYLLESVVSVKADDGISFQTL